MTAGQLRKALEGHPDNTEVVLPVFDHSYQRVQAADFEAAWLELKPNLLSEPDPEEPNTLPEGCIFVPVIVIR